MPERIRKEGSPSSSLKRFKSSKSIRRFPPIPKRIISFYGIIAVILVIIPEALAKFLIDINATDGTHKLLKKDIEWEINPELKLAEMNLKELRLLAKHLRLFGYSSETAQSLRKRLLKKFSSQLPVS